MKIKELKQGQQVRVFGGTGSYIVEVIRVVTDMTHYRDIAYVKNANGKERILTDNHEFELRHSLDPTKWLEKSNDLQQRKRGELNINIGMEIEPNDTVNHPSHYNYGDIEVIDFIEQVTQHYNANVAYHIGNAIKYLARSPHKNGKEDVDKAKWYIERAFENWDK